MTLRTKVQLVVTALRSPSLSKYDKAGIWFGAFFAIFRFPLLGLAAAAAVAAEWMTALSLATFVVLWTHEWQHTWRVAVDMPMADAWSRLTVVRAIAAACWLFLAALNVIDGDYVFAVLDVLLAWLIWRRRDNGGWDDVPAPTPDPTLGNTR